MREIWKVFWVGKTSKKERYIVRSLRFFTTLSKAWMFALTNKRPNESIIVQKTHTALTII